MRQTQSHTGASSLCASSPPRIIAWGCEPYGWCVRSNVCASLCAPARRANLSCGGGAKLRGLLYMRGSRAVEQQRRGNNALTSQKGARMRSYVEHGHTSPVLHPLLRCFVARRAGGVDDERGGLRHSHLRPRDRPDQMRQTARWAPLHRCSRISSSPSGGLWSEV
jgi:hypothetical protein